MLMRDIPFFTTENGVASLTLREIVYKKTAYIKIQSSLNPMLLLHDCVCFCKAVGAELIYASGSTMLEKYPFYTSIVKMAANRKNIPTVGIVPTPVTHDTAEAWRTIYNDRMKDVPNAATITLSEREKMIELGNAFFVYDHDTLLGIGKVEGNSIESLAAVARGSGKIVLSSLSSLINHAEVIVEVATANEPAIRLYDSLGFSVKQEISRWYRVK